MVFNPAAPMAPSGTGYVTPEQWAQQIATIQAALAASSGFERLKLQSQLDDAKAARANALKIAQLQADNSRYGYDLSRQTALDQLQENARQFDARHALDVRNADLSEAQLIAQQRSQPNRLFQTMDLEQALGRIRNGFRATTMPMTTGIAAIDGLSTDYTANPYLANPYLKDSGAGGGGGSVTPTASAPVTTNAAPASGGAAPTSAGADPRLSAANAVLKALPPSATEGLDPTGVAALNAVYHLYAAPLQPGTLQSLSPTQKAGLQSGAERLQQYTGKSYDDLMADYYKSAPGMGSVRGY